MALQDDEYPEWLWTILSRQEKNAEKAGMGDLFCMSCTLLDILLFYYCGGFIR